MKTRITLILTLLAIIVGLRTNSQTITISKKNLSDPTEVCNNSTYRYVATTTGLQNNYTVAWVKSNADIQSQSTSEAEV